MIFFVDGGFQLSVPNAAAGLIFGDEVLPLTSYNKQPTHKATAYIYICFKNCSCIFSEADAITQHAVISFCQ